MPPEAKGAPVKGASVTKYVAAATVWFCILLVGWGLDHGRFTSSTYFDGSSLAYKMSQYGQENKLHTQRFKEPTEPSAADIMQHTSQDVSNNPVSPDKSQPNGCIYLARSNAYLCPEPEEGEEQCHLAAMKQLPECMTIASAN